MTRQVYSQNMNAEEIQAIRKNLGLTQKGLAELLDIDAITVSRWERGERHPHPVSSRKLQRLDRKRTK